MRRVYFRPSDPSRPSATVSDVQISPDELAGLRRAAEDARLLNYSPYSDFVVLAAARTVSGAIGGGSNVENVNFSLTKHAEEVAVLAALRVGGEPPRAGAIDVVYVAGAMPCGGCRQFALEFGNTDSLWVIDLVPQELLRRGSLLELPASVEVTISFGDALPGAFDAATPGIRRVAQSPTR